MSTSNVANGSHELTGDHRAALNFPLGDEFAGVEELRAQARSASPREIVGRDMVELKVDRDRGDAHRKIVVDVARPTDIWQNIGRDPRLSRTAMLHNLGRSMESEST